MTVYMECDSPKGGVRDIRNVCQVPGRCDGLRGGGGGV